MKTVDIFKLFEINYPDTSKEIVSYGTINGAKDAIKMRDKKGHLYIFQYSGPDRWSLYYGAAAVDFERRIKNGRI